MTPQKRLARMRRMFDEDHAILVEDYEHFAGPLEASSTPRPGESTPRSRVVRSVPIRLRTTERPLYYTGADVGWCGKSTRRGARFRAAARRGRRPAELGAHPLGWQNSGLPASRTRGVPLRLRMWYKMHRRVATVNRLREVGP